jgi:hypothetical protein
MLALWIFLGVIWFAIGFWSSARLLWRKYKKFFNTDLIPLFLSGLLGPLSIGLFCLCHMKEKQIWPRE